MASLIDVPIVSSYSEIAGTDKPGYVYMAGPRDWDLFIQDAKANVKDLIIMYDYETKMTYTEPDESEFDKTIRELTQWQCSLRPYQAVVSRWDPDWGLTYLTRVLEQENDKGDYNGRGFDRWYNKALGIRKVDGQCFWETRVKELIAMGAEFIGKFHDLMDMWHHWEPDLPRGLQYACSFVPSIAINGPWKHTFPLDPMAYGAKDVDYPQRLWYWLKKKLQGLSHPITKVSLWDGYLRQVNELCAKSLDRMQDRGIPVNEQRRLALWDELAAMEREEHEKVQALIPDDLRPVKQKEGLKTIPLFIRKNPEVLAQAERDGRVYCEALESWYVKREFKLKDSPDGVVSRWCQLQPWNPNSTEQVKDYIRWKRDQEIQGYLDAMKCRHQKDRVDQDTPPDPHSCPECRKTAERKAVYKIPLKYRSTDETTEKKELRRLFAKTKDPVLKISIDIREIQKMAGTYVGSPDPESKKKGWRPDDDGCAHPFFTTAPATGQLSSKEPNAQNFPKHNPKFAKMMRGMIQAPPGYCLIEADFRAFHVLTTGFEANDPTYMRLAKLDMHSFFCSTRLTRTHKHEELLKLSDTDMIALFEELKADKTPRYKVDALPDPVPFKFIRDKQAKPTILGYGFGMGASRLQHENQEFIASIPEADRLIRALDEAFPITKAWRGQIQQIAADQGYLLSRHGYIRRFNSVFSWKPIARNEIPKPGWKIVMGRDGFRWRIANGDDAEAAIAFLPANDAFGHIKEAMIDLEDCGAGEEFGLINQIHDALVFLCPWHLRFQCLKIAKARMEAPSKYLILPNGEGLACQAEFSISPNGGSWAECQEVHDYELAAA